MSAAGAHAVQFQFVGLYGEAVATGDFLLQTFDVFILELDDLAASGTNEVIVMPFMRHIIVLSLCPEVAGLGQPDLAKEIQRPIDSGQTNMRIFFRELPIHLLGGDVLILQEHVQNMLALSREF